MSSSAPDVPVLPLDPLVRRLFVGMSLSSLGSGLTLPFLFVYLSVVRDLPASTTGLLFAWMGLVGLVASPLAGTLIDRKGPRVVVLAGLTVEATGVLLIGWVSTVGQAMVVLAVVSAGASAMWPATTALLTRMVPEVARERAYGIQFMLMNAGLGVGGLVSALIVDVEDVASFQRLYQLDSLTYLAYIAVVASLPAAVGALPVPVTSAAGAAAEEPEPGWREVLQDRTLLRVAAVTVLLVTFGYAQMEAGFTAYAVNVADVPEQALGAAFAANTAAIVLGQLWVLRWIRGRRRTRTLALTASVWSFAWLVIALSALTGQWLSVVLVVVGLGVFGIGETLWAPVAPAVVNALASERARGRYNALFSGAWTFSMILGPAIAGLLIGNGLAGLWVVCTVGGTALGARVLLGLAKHLSAAQDGVGETAAGPASTA